MQLSNRKACSFVLYFIYFFVCQSSTPIRSAVLHMYQPLLTNQKWPMIGDRQIDPITCQVFFKVPALFQMASNGAFLDGFVKQSI